MRIIEQKSKRAKEQKRKSGFSIVKLVIEHWLAYK